MTTGLNSCIPELVSEASKTYCASDGFLQPDENESTMGPNVRATRLSRPRMCALVKFGMSLVFAWASHLHSFEWPGYGSYTVSQRPNNRKGMKQAVWECPAQE